MLAANFVTINSMVYIMLYYGVNQNLEIEHFVCVFALFCFV